jgi:hypothetical protein
MTPTKERRVSGADQLLARVHQRLGWLGVDIATFGGSDDVEIRWRRNYNGAWSDERQTSAQSLVAALQAVLDWEDAADEADELETGSAQPRSEEAE